jgi:hypothetical protein
MIFADHFGLEARIRAACTGSIIPMQERKIEIRKDRFKPADV